MEGAGDSNSRSENPRPLPFGRMRLWDWSSALAFAMATPVIVLILRASESSWLAVGDYSLIELQTRAVGTAHTPLIGPYSRFGWSHPGPALFFLLALPYHLLSSHSKGLLAGAGVINVVAIVMSGIALKRVGRDTTRVVFGFFIVAVLLRALGASFLWDAWNPYVIVWPFLALVLLSIWVSVGEHRALPVAAGFASFVSQTHVSLALEAGALLAVACLWLLRRVVDQDRERMRRSILLSVLVVAVMWSPPVLEQLQSGGGNLGALVRFWTSHHQVVGFRARARIISPQLTIPAPWITGHVPQGNIPGYSFPFGLVALAIAAFVAIRRRDRTAMSACSIALCVVLVAWISVSRIVGAPYPYIVRWTWVVGPTCWLASGYALLPAVSERLAHSREMGLRLAMAVVATCLLGIVTVQSISVEPPLVATSAVAWALITEALPSLRVLPGPLLVDTGVFSYTTGNLLGGIVVGAVERGLDARYPPSLAGLVAPRDVVTPRRAGTLLFVVIGNDIQRLLRDPANRELARYSNQSASAVLFARSPP